jgi:hypothetical protein
MIEVLSPGTRRRDEGIKDGTVPLTSPLLPELSIDLRRLFSGPRRSVPGTATQG